MKPIEALEKLIDWSFLSSVCRHDEPGEVLKKYAKPGTEIGEAIQKLTSDDAKNVRIK